MYIIKNTQRILFGTLGFSPLGFTISLNRQAAGGLQQLLRQQMVAALHGPKGSWHGPARPKRLEMVP